MAKGTHFGRVLCRLRQEQGFDHAYSFYKQRGGQKIFGLTFANYLSLEKSGSLPNGRRLRKLISILGIDMDAVGVRDLVYAYFQDVLGSDELLSFMTAKGADPAPPSWQAAENATRQAIRQRSVQLTMDHYRVIAKDALAYQCHVILANTRGWVEIALLARMIGKPPQALKRSLDALKGVGLLRRSAGKVCSPLAGKYVVPPAVTPATASIYARLREYRQRWVETKGRLVHSPYLILRASESQFSSYLAHLTDVVRMSAVYGSVEPSPDSAIFLVEARATRLFTAKD